MSSNVRPMEKDACAELAEVLTMINDIARHLICQYYLRKNEVKELEATS